MTLSSAEKVERMIDPTVPVRQIAGVQDIVYAGKQIRLAGEMLCPCGFRLRRPIDSQGQTDLTFGTNKLTLILLRSSSV